ncbi:MAG: hypothetical protein ACI9VM_000156 [Candidatus Azotimanducaceae bacterium]|jgi:hypothetical protein
MENLDQESMSAAQAQEKVAETLQETSFVLNVEPIVFERDETGDTSLDLQGQVIDTGIDMVTKDDDGNETGEKRVMKVPGTVEIKGQTFTPSPGALLKCVEGEMEAFLDLSDNPDTFGKIHSQEIMH